MPIVDSAIPPKLSLPSPVPVEWRARVESGAWFRWLREPLLFQHAFEARREAARRFGVGTEYVVVERVS